MNYSTTIHRDRKSQHLQQLCNARCINGNKTLKNRFVDWYEWAGQNYITWPGQKSTNLRRIGIISWENIPHLVVVRFFVVVSSGGLGGNLTIFQLRYLLHFVFIDDLLRTAREMGQFAGQFSERVAEARVVWRNDCTLMDFLNQITRSLISSSYLSHV